MTFSVNQNMVGDELLIVNEWIGFI